MDRPEIACQAGGIIAQGKGNVGRIILLNAEIGSDQRALVHGLVERQLNRNPADGSHVPIARRRNGAGNDGRPFCDDITGLAGLYKIIGYSAGAGPIDDASHLNQSVVDKI